MAARPRQEGAALLMAMAAMLLLSVAVLQARRGVDLYETMAYAAADEVQGSFLARSGLALVQAALEEDDRDVDSFADGWAVANTVGALPVGDLGWVTGRVEDEEGKLDVNRLVGTDDEPDELQEAKVWALLTTLGLPPERAEEIVDSLIDWIDANGTESPSGAEAAFYDALPRPYAPADAPLTTPGEMALVRGIGWGLLFVGEGEVPPLSRYLTVYGDPSGAVNVNTAPVEVLTSLTPEGAEGVEYLIERDLAEEIVAVRAESPFESPSALKERVPAFHEDLYNQVAPYLDVRSGHFSARVTGETERASVTAYGIFARGSASGTHLVYYRRF